MREYNNVLLIIRMLVDDSLGGGQTSVEAALWKLRDSLMKDAHNIRNQYSNHE